MSSCITQQEEEFSFDEVFEYEYCNCSEKEYVLLPKVEKSTVLELKNKKEISVCPVIHKEEVEEDVIEVVELDADLLFTMS